MPIDVAEYSYDDDLLEAGAQGVSFQFKVYPFPTTAIVLGRGGKIERELNLDTCEADGIPVLRRRGGGGTVVLDPGNIVVSAVAKAEGVGDIKLHFNHMLDWLQAGLTKTGIENVSQNGISDLVVGNRKFSGTSLYRPKNWVFFTASILVSPDFSKIDRYLQHPPREPEYRQGRSHRDFLIGLEEVSSFSSAHDLAIVLHSSLSEELS